MRKKSTAEKPVNNPEAYVLDDDTQLFTGGSDVRVFDWQPRDRNGYSWKDVNIYLQKGETADLVLVPHKNAKGELTVNPYIFQMHTLVLTGKFGKFFPRERCISEFQVEGQPDDAVGTCPLCDASMSTDNISPARNTLFYLVIDLRGKRLQGGGFDGKPRIGFLRMPPKFHVQIKSIHEQIPEMNWLVIRVKRTQNDHTAMAVMERTVDGGYQPKYWTQGWHDPIPVITEILQPRPWEHYLKLVELATTRKGQVFSQPQPPQQTNENE